MTYKPLANVRCKVHWTVTVWVIGVFPFFEDGEDFGAFPGFGEVVVI